MSNRYDLIVENVLYPSNVIIAPGAIKMAGETIPVTIGFGGLPVGRAFNMERDEDGVVSVEVELFPQSAMDHKWLRMLEPSVGMFRLEQHADPPIRLIEGASLREASFVPEENFPRVSIPKKE